MQPWVNRPVMKWELNNMSIILVDKLQSVFYNVYQMEQGSHLSSIKLLGKLYWSFSWVFSCFNTPPPFCMGREYLVFFLRLMQMEINHEHKKRSWRIFNCYRWVSSTPYTIWSLTIYISEKQEIQGKRECHKSTDWKGIWGHEVCRDRSWINNLFWFYFKDAYLYLPSFHPRRIQYSLYNEFKKPA